MSNLNAGGCKADVVRRRRLIFETSAALGVVVGASVLLCGKGSFVGGLSRGDETGSGGMWNLTFFCAGEGVGAEVDADL